MLLSPRSRSPLALAMPLSPCHFRHATFAMPLSAGAIITRYIKFLESNRRVVLDKRRKQERGPDGEWPLLVRHQSVKNSFKVTVRTRHDSKYFFSTELAVESVDMA